MRHGVVLSVLLLAGCGGSYNAGSVPTPVNGFRAEDRVVIGDFSRVNAIAGAPDRIYVAYAYGVALWHPFERRWDVPSSPSDVTLLPRVTRAVVDPLDRTLWLAAGLAWLHYDPASNRWDSGRLPSRASVVEVDLDNPGGGAWFRTDNGWFNVAHAGIVATPSAPPRRPDQGSTVEDAERDLPALRALAPHIATGPLLQQGTLTAAARDPQGTGWYIGTSNRGLVFFDRLATDATPIPLGLPGSLVGALAVDDDQASAPRLATGDSRLGVWVATDAELSQPAAITRLATDAGVTASLTGLPSRGVPFTQSRALLVRGDTVWAATDQGVVTTVVDAGEVQPARVAAGTEASRTFALAQHQGMRYAGTDRGLLVSRAGGEFVRADAAFGESVYALGRRADTLWVGTARGLFALVGDAAELRMPEGFHQLAGGRFAILGVGYAGDTLIAMTPDRLLWRDPVSGAWALGPVLSDLLGPLRAFDATSGGAWVGGARGAAFVQPATLPLRTLLMPSALPDEVTAIVSSGGYLWIGTRSGLVRWLLAPR